VKHLLYFLFFQQWKDGMFKLKGNICILASIVFNILKRNIAHITLIFALLPNKFFYMDRFIGKKLIAEQIHISLAFGIYHIMRKHGIITGSCYFHPIPFQYQDIIF